MFSQFIITIDNFFYAFGMILAGIELATAHTLSGH